jgi:oligopeptide transport system substrate-binding protein
LTPAPSANSPSKPTVCRRAARFALAGLLLLLPLGLSLAACRPEPTPKGVIRWEFGNDPPTLDSTKATDVQSGFVLGHVNEGLTDYGPDGKLAPAVASSWELRERGATFHLRKDALWSDGKPVTAHDFVFAWRTVVDPNTASEYAFILFPVKNAEAINASKNVKVETLGVKAVDDWTLEVEFERPCPYFLGLTAFKTYFPVREDFYRSRGDRYAATPQDLLYNGPFVLTHWDHGASLTMEKNPRYWNAARIKLDRIEIPYFTNDNNAVVNLFKDGKIDMLGIGRDTIKRAQVERWRMKNYDDGGLYYLEFNQRPGRPTANVHLRRAIQLVYDGKEFVSKIMGVPGMKPGRSLIPQWVKGLNGPFNVEYPVPALLPDPEAAKRELALAEKELGKKVTNLVWLTGDTPLASREAEYFQWLLKARLGIHIEIDKQVFQQRLAKMSAGDFDLEAGGWAPDYDDAMTFADLFTSFNENNRGKFKNAEYDRLIREALETPDLRHRLDNIAKAQRIALDEVAILPMYENSTVYVETPRVHGILRRRFGTDPDFTYATADEAH